MRILLAVEGSAGSLQARDLVASVRWPRGSTIRLITVRGTEPALPAAVEVERLAAPLVGLGWHVEAVTAVGPPATALLEAADRLSADLIVLGARGLGPLVGVSLGSVAAAVTNRATRPVVVARGPRVSALLLATDGSAGADAAVERLAPLTTVGQAPAIKVLSVIPQRSAHRRLVDELYPKGDAPGDHERRDTAQARLAVAEESARRLRRLGLHAVPVLRAGDPGREIVAAAGEFGSDLIVIGSHDAAGPRPALMGSVAHEVLSSAACSVLVVRRPPPALVASVASVDRGPVGESVAAAA